MPPEEADWVIDSADGKGPKQLVDGVLNKEVHTRCCCHTTSRHAVLVPSSRLTFGFTCTRSSCP